MAFVAPILAIGGTLLSAFGSIQQGRQRQQAANFNAALAQRESQSSQVRGNVSVQASGAAAAREERLGRRRRGAAQAAIGASGITLSGSSLDVLADLAAESALDVELARFEGDLASFETREQVVSKQAESAQARRRGKQARRSGLFQAGGTLLTGGARAHELGVFD